MIDAHARAIRELLGGSKYAVDYYQRDYKWEMKQVAELVAILQRRFVRVMTKNTTAAVMSNATATIF
jgi:hypothetical protein